MSKRPRSHGSIGTRNRPIFPEDVTAAIYPVLGIDWTKSLSGTLPAGNFVYVEPMSGTIAAARKLVGYPHDSSRFTIGYRTLPDVEEPSSYLYSHSSVITLLDRDFLFDKGEDKCLRGGNDKWLQNDF
jgi:hypothetical protein